MRKPPGRKVSWRQRVLKLQLGTGHLRSWVPEPGSRFRNWLLSSGTEVLVPEPGSGTGTRWLVPVPKVQILGNWSFTDF